MERGHTVRQRAKHAPTLEENFPRVLFALCAQADRMFAISLNQSSERMILRQNGKFTRKYDDKLRRFS